MTFFFASIHMLYSCTTLKTVDVLTILFQTFYQILYEQYCNLRNPINSINSIQSSGTWKLLSMYNIQIQISRISICPQQVKPWSKNPTNRYYHNFIRHLFKQLLDRSWTSRNLHCLFYPFQVQELIIYAQHIITIE